MLNIPIHCMTDDNKKKLRIYNLVMGLFHLIQFFIMFFASKQILKPIFTYLPSPDIKTRTFSLIKEQAFEINLGQAISFFLLFSAIAHLTIILPKVYPWYVKNIKKEINLVRWYEYAFSSSLMVVIIAYLCQIDNLAILVLLFGINACMNLFGAMMEKQNSLLKQNAKEFEKLTITETEDSLQIIDKIETSYKTDWTAFIYGVFAGILPWIVMGAYFFTTINKAGNDVKIPDFVYYIFPTLFVFFNLFAINMALQYGRVGKWKNYLFGEYVYIFLSLAAKSVLAWLIWGGTLR